MKEILMAEKEMVSFVLLYFYVEKEHSCDQVIFRIAL